MKKTFNLAEVLMLTTGRSLTSFNKMHELAEHVAGHPIWTHEFAEEALWRRLREQVFKQHPVLREALVIVCESKDPATIDLIIRDYLEENEEKFGNTFEFERGDGERTESPIESMQRIAPDKPILGVVVDKE